MVTTNHTFVHVAELGVTGPGQISYLPTCSSQHPSLLRYYSISTWYTQSDEFQSQRRGVISLNNSNLHLLFVWTDNGVLLQKILLKKRGTHQLCAVFVKNHCMTLMCRYISRLLDHLLNEMLHFKLLYFAFFFKFYF